MPRVARASLGQLALKGSQSTMRDDVRLFLDAPATPLAQGARVSKGCGRIETRFAGVSSDAVWLKERWRRGAVERSVARRNLRRRSV